MTARRTTALQLRLVALSAVVAIAGNAAAHGGPPSLLTVTVTDEGADVALRTDASLLVAVVPALAQLGARSPREQVVAAWRAVDAALGEGLVFQRGGLPCSVDWSQATAAADATVALSGRARCRGSGQLTLRHALYAAVTTQHRVVVRVRGGSAQTTTLALGGVVTLDSGGGPLATVARFSGAGVEHILSGAEHVMFVCGLLLLAGGRLRPLLWTISGFTLAHTFSLLLATLGAVAVRGNLVEPLVAASIAYVGVEGLAARGGTRAALLVLVVLHAAAVVAAATGRLPLPPLLLLGLVVFAVGFGGWLAGTAAGARPRPAGAGLRYALFPFLFGLVHGLGFAGPMLDLDLSGWQLAWGLLGFNAGVEVGQAALVAAVTTVVAAAWRLWPQARGRPATYAAYGAAALLIAAGATWFSAAATRAAT